MGIAGAVRMLVVLQRDEMPLRPVAAFLALLLSVTAISADASPPPYYDVAVTLREANAQVHLAYNFDELKGRFGANSSLSVIVEPLGQDIRRGSDRSSCSRGDGQLRASR